VQSFKPIFVKSVTYAALSMSLALLSACGSGNSDGGVNGPDLPAGVTIGPVTSSNPLIVNNIRWELSSVPTTIEDADDDARGLLPGFITRVQGGINTGNSTGRGASITTGAELRGAVTAIDTTRLAFTVLGVEAVASASTFFENLPTGIAGIQTGDMLQVNGYPTHDNKIIATRIIKRATNTVFKLTGTVAYDTCTNDPAATCPAAGTLMRVGTMNVTVAPEAISGGLSFPVPTGTLVKISATGTPTGTALTAASVKPYAGEPLLADAIVIVNGVSAAYSAGNFRFNGTQVTTTATTKIIGTLPIDTLAANGSLLQVEGRYKGGTIEATSVKRL
jgi:hypothetical protein